MVDLELYDALSQEPEGTSISFKFTKTLRNAHLTLWNITKGKI